MVNDYHRRPVRPTTTAGPWCQGIRLGLLGCLAVIMGSGCSRPTDLGSSATILFGTVLSSAGAPVVNARVTATGYYEGCSGMVMLNEGRQTDASGRYSVLLQVAVDSREVCLDVTAVDPTGSEAVTVYGIRATFLRESERFPPDSVRVDLRFN